MILKIPSSSLYLPLENWTIVQLQTYTILSAGALDCVNTMPPHFENGEKFDG